MRQKLAKCSFLGKPSHIYQSHSASRLVLHSAYLNSKNKPWSHSCTKYFHKSECKQIQARCHIFQKTARPVMAKLIFYSSEFCYCTSDSLTYLASPLSLSCSEVSSFEPLSFLLACSGSCSLHSNMSILLGQALASWLWLPHWSWEQLKTLTPGTDALRHDRPSVLGLP